MAVRKRFLLEHREKLCNMKQTVVLIISRLRGADPKIVPEIGRIRDLKGRMGVI